MNGFREVLKAWVDIAQEKAMAATRPVKDFFSALARYVTNLKNFILQCITFISEKLRLYWSRYFWQKFRAITIQDKPIGASIDESTAELKKHRSKLQKWLFQYDW